MTVRQVSEARVVLSPLVISKIAAVTRSPEYGYLFGLKDSEEQRILVSEILPVNVKMLENDASKKKLSSKVSANQEYLMENNIEYSIIGMYAIYQSKLDYNCIADELIRLELDYNDIILLSYDLNAAFQFNGAIMAHMLPQKISEQGNKKMNFESKFERRDFVSRLENLIKVGIDAKSNNLLDLTGLNYSLKVQNEDINLKDHHFGRMLNSFSQFLNMRLYQPTERPQRRKFYGNYRRKQ